MNSKIDWAGVAQMTIVVVVVLWSAVVVCLLWEIRQALEQVLMGQDYLAQMLDIVWGQLGGGEYIFPYDEDLYLNQSHD